MRRREFLCRSAAAVGLAALSAPLLAQKTALDPERTAAQLIKPQTQAAIDRGLAWLAGRQNDDGSFGGSGYSRNVAVVSLAGMAFLSGGHTPGRGEYGQHVNRCVNYVLAAADDSGFICEPALHQPRADVRPRLRDAVSGRGLRHVARYARFARSWPRAVRLIVSDAKRRGRLALSAEGDRGGHLGHDLPGDGAAGGPQRGHLRAERDDRPLRRLRQAEPERRRRLHVHADRRAEPLSADRGGRRRAVSARASMKGEEIRRGIEYLEQHRPAAEEFSRDTHAMYGHYYAVQAMWQAGGEHWQKWYPAVHDILLKQQQDDGSWKDLICPEYGTAMAAIILQMPNNYLPIFQR